MTDARRDRLCLKWDDRGELSMVDLATVLERLRLADDQARTIDRCELVVPQVSRRSVA